MPAVLSGKRYAQAILEIAQEENQLEEWRSGLKKIAQVMQDPELLTFLESPKLPFDLKRKLVEDRLKEVVPSALNLVFLLITKGRAKLAPLIAAEYEHLLDTYYGIEHAKLTTAISLDNKDKERVVHSLEALTGHRVITEVEVAPNIIGGIIVKIGDKLIDGSIKSQLDALKKNLVAVGK